MGQHFKSVFQAANLFRNALLYQFDVLETMPQEEGPKFVFAHILCPHLPYVFGQNGEKVSSKDAWNTSNKSLYLNQYIYTTKKVEKLIDTLLSKSKIPHIIIIQSDHGSKMDIKYVHNVFNAIYMPGGASKILKPDSSPQNTFRLIFNHYFNQSFPLLPD